MADISFYINLTRIFIRILFFSLINLVIAEFALYCPTDYLFQRSFDKEVQV